MIMIMYGDPIELTEQSNDYLKNHVTVIMVSFMVSRINR